MNFKKETIRKISQNKGKLEKKLKVKIQIKGQNISLSGNEFDTYIAEKVFGAVERTFPIPTALLLTNEDYMLEDIPIKDITKKDVTTVKARIIGTKGKTLRTMQELSECNIVLHNNTVSILGPAEKIKDAENAVKSLIRGSKQSNVYKYLERQKKKLEIEDLGLKQQL